MTGPEPDWLEAGEEPTGLEWFAAQDVKRWRSLAIARGITVPGDTGGFPQVNTQPLLALPPVSLNGSNPAPGGDPVTARHAELKAALLDADGLRKIPAPEPLVDGLLFVNTLAWISGKPGCAKTFAALDLACCTGTGLPWHGHPVRQGPVLYVIAEGAAGLGQRAGAWAALNRTAATGVTFLPVPVQIMDGTDAGALALLAAELKPVLIVVDTQARATVGADENSSKDMGVLVAWLDHLRRACKACVLLVHHTPRNAENLRGSTALEGAADTIIAVTKDGPRVTIRNDAQHGGKQKDVPEAGPLALSLVPAGSSAALSSQLGTVTASLTQSQADTLEMVRRLGEASPTRIADASELSKATVTRALLDLTERHLIVKTGRGNMVRYKLPGAEDLNSRSGSDDREPQPEIEAHEAHEAQSGSSDKTLPDQPKAHEAHEAHDPPVTEAQAHTPIRGEPDMTLTRNDESSLVENRPGDQASAAPASTQVDTSFPPGMPPENQALLIRLTIPEEERTPEQRALADAYPG